MKFSFFEALTDEEAKEYFDDFLDFGRGRAMKILSEKMHFTIDLDFQIDSISEVFISLLNEMNTIQRETDENLPDFIRSTESYKQNLFDFDESSKTIVLAGAFYLGETFVRSYESLSWGIGNREFAQGNMPVVKGFSQGMELAPILVAENMFRGMISQISDESSIGRLLVLGCLLFEKS